MNSLALALRILKRDWRKGELHLLLFALIITCACLNTVSNINLSVKSLMFSQSAQMLGGNAVIKSPVPIQKAWVEKAHHDFSLHHAQSIEFLSVLSTTNQLQIATLKAVSPSYPLFGDLEVSRRPYAKGKAVHHIPKAGTIWLESRLFSSLEISPNAKVQVGASLLRANRALVKDPVISGSLFDFNAKAIMRLEDLATTKIIQPGSRASYRLYLSGEQTLIKQFHVWLKPKLLAGQEFITADEDQLVLKNAYSRIHYFLILSSLFSLIICGLVIGLCTRRYLNRHAKHIALMRCYGARSSKILLIYSFMLFLLTLLGISLGNALSLALNPVTFYFIAQLFPNTVAILGLKSMILNYGYAMILVFGFSLPSLMHLKAVRALDLFRPSSMLMPTQFWQSVTLTPLIALTLLSLQLGEIVFPLQIIGIVSVLSIIFGALCYGLLKQLKWVQSWFRYPWRYGVMSILRTPQHAMLQIIAFGLSLCIVLSVFFIWRDLLTHWQEQLPNNAANYFLFNISPSQQDDLQQFFKQREITASRLYPMVRGRLTQINHKDVFRVVSPQAKEHNALHRELNLTWTSTLPANNRIRKGRWWQQADKRKALISVENNLAQQLGLRLGDVLTFQVGAQNISARIISLRSVDWTQFTPNFYVIFPEGVLDDFPSTIVTSFYLPQNKQKLLQEIVRQFPNSSLIDVAKIIAMMRSSVFAMAMVIAYLTLFLIISGICILIASTQATLDKRKQEGLLLRLLGAKRISIMLGMLTEFFIIGLLSGLMALLLSLSITYYVGTQLLDLPFRVSIAQVVICTLFSPGVIALAGWFSTRMVRKQSLREIINV